MASYELPLMSFLAGIPRFTLRLSTTEAREDGLYDITSTDYAWSLFWIGMLGVMFASVLVLAFVIVAFVRRCCRTQTIAPSRLHLLMAVLTLGTAAAASYFLVETYIHSVSVLSSTSSMADAYASTVAGLRSNATFFDPSSVSALRQQLQWYNLPRDVNMLNEVVAVLAEQPTNYNDVFFPTLDYSSATGPAGVLGNAVMVIIVDCCALALFAFLHLGCADRRTRRCSSLIFMVLCLIASFLAISLSTTLLAALVPAADMCPQPTPYATAFGESYVDFYVGCAGTAPYFDLFQESLLQLQEARGNLMSIENDMRSAGVYPLTNVEALLAGITAASSFLYDASTEIAQCDTVYFQLGNIFTEACGDTSRNAFIGLWLALVLGVLFYVDAILLLFLDPMAPVPREVNQERTPLLDDETGNGYGSINNRLSPDHCRICCERVLTRAFNCGHMMCEQCSIQLTQCPFCREPITQRLQVYIV